MQRENVQTSVRGSGAGTTWPQEDEPAGRDREYAHLDSVLARYAASDSGPARATLREKLIIGFLPVARNIARRYASASVSHDDLAQVGTEGLIKAVDRYDPTRGMSFLAYAVPTIRGEILRYFRDHTWAMRVPRRIKDLAVAVRQATPTLGAQLGRAPRPAEIAAWLDAELEDVLEALQANHECSVRSLDEPLGFGEFDDGDGVAALLGQPDARLELVDGRNSVAPLIAALPERERTILMLRFFADMTQTQIAEQVGVSQMHVSRLLSHTLAGLREQLCSPAPSPADPDVEGSTHRGRRGGPDLGGEASAAPVKLPSPRREMRAKADDRPRCQGQERPNPGPAPAAHPHRGRDPWRAGTAIRATGTLPELAIPLPGTVLAFSTHPGEVLCAAGGILSALAWAGSEVHVLDVGDDEGGAARTPALGHGHRRWRTRSAHPLLGLPDDHRYRLSASIEPQPGPAAVAPPDDGPGADPGTDTRTRLAGVLRGVLSELAGHRDTADGLLVAPCSRDGHPDHDLADGISEHLAQTQTPDPRLRSYLTAQWTVPEPLARLPATARRFNLRTALREHKYLALGHLSRSPPNRPTPAVRRWGILLTDRSG